MPQYCTFTNGATINEKFTFGSRCVVWTGQASQKLWKANVYDKHNTSAYVKKIYNKNDSKLDVVLTCVWQNQI